jgi:hypothetical protein
MPIERSIIENNNPARIKPYKALRSILGLIAVFNSIKCTYIFSEKANKLLIEEINKYETWGRLADLKDYSFGYDIKEK